MMSTIRTQWNDAAWFNWGYNVSRVSGSSFLVTSATNSTVTLPAAFEANGRIKLYDSTTLYGTITTVSASAASTLVTFTPDAFSLTSSFSSVYNSIIPASNTPIPGLNIPTDVVTQTTQQIYGVDNGATNSAHINLTPVLSSYVSGQLINFKVLQTNTGPATLQIGSLGNKTIKKNINEDLEAGDIQSGQIVPVVYDGTNFQIVGGSGGGSAAGNAVQQEITQTAHGFSVGHILYLNNSTYTKAKADAATTAEVVGMVSSVTDANNYILTTNGYVSGLSGLGAGSVYFLDPSTAGAMTLTEPSTAGQISKPIFIADSTTSGYVVNFRGNIVEDPVDTSPGLAKAWVSFNGNTQATGASYNVSSITYNSTGDYTINFTSALADANYVCLCEQAPDNASTTSGAWVVGVKSASGSGPVNKTSAHVQIKTASLTSGGAATIFNGGVACFR